MIFDLINTDPGFASSNTLENIPGAGTYSFMPGSYDTKEDFLNSLAEKPQDWYYRHNPVEYTINSHKFRTKEFKDIDWKNSIVLLGCSHTFGIGVTDEHTIAANLEKITGKTVVNLGQPGFSNGLISYNSYYLKENYPTPLGVVNIWTNMVRWFEITPEQRRLETKVYCDIEKSTADRINTIVTNNIMYMKMSNALWKDHPNHIQLCVSDYKRDLKTRLLSITQKVFPEVIRLKKGWEQDMSARDNAHWGRETTEKIAKLIASNLKL